MTPARTIRIGPDEAGQRLDRFLRKLLHDVSLSAIYRLVRTRQVIVNDRKARPESRLNEGDSVTLFAAAEDRHLKPKVRRRAEQGLSTRRDFAVVYEDEHVVAVNKPAGVLVHAGDRGDDRDTLINQVTGWLLSRPLARDAASHRDFVRPSPTFAPALAHRIDRETSGLVLIGKTLAATQALAAAIRHREIEKTYLALAVGGLPRREGEINVPIARHEDARGRRRKVETGHGARAVTRYRVLDQRGQYTLVELDLVTGRTHQIRAHLAHAGAPVAGDDEYGSREHNRHAAERLGLRRQWLHAARLRLQHPVTGAALDLCAPLWPELNHALAAAGLAHALPDWLAGARETAP
ncbi:MAG: RluA family pseudouridine synthase [Planctomycetes bacterium]|jgi:23S rRNA pseudouridine955/2504/2580 synthase|nr:RluA family pseudouridine synthase [Planctomycetota bacterium]MCL4729716.1 RluA family pseudouridine synthase [Planctomycetota bacterium]